MGACINNIMPDHNIENIVPYSLPEGVGSLTSPANQYKVNSTQNMQLCDIKIKIWIKYTVL